MTPHVANQLPHVTGSYTLSLNVVLRYKGGEKGDCIIWLRRVAVTSAKNHKRQRRKRQTVTAKREKSQTPKVLTAILTLPNLTQPNLT